MAGLERDVMPVLDQEGADLVAAYLTGDRFTGSRFDSFSGGGDRPDAANRFTADDVVAVSLLSVDIPPRASRELLEDQASRLSELLSAVPTDVALTDAAAHELIARGSVAEHLWSELRDIEGIGWVTAHKLCARKRPALLPVYDRVVKAALQPTRSAWWLPLWETLQRQEVVDRLVEIRAEVGRPEVSLLRILDVAVWMWNWGARD
jgi:hypothetical protein